MRKSMKKLIALTLACLMLATLFVGCGKKDDGGSSGGDTIKLGWMGSLTGDQAAYGTCESQTLKMMVEDLNAICVGFPEGPVLTAGMVRMMDGSMAKHCQLWNSRNFAVQDWSTGFGNRKALTRKNIWLCSNGYRKWNRSARRTCRSLPRNVSVPAKQSVN